MRVIGIPVKSLQGAKTRLSPVLSPEERARLAVAMFDDVLAACRLLPGWEVWVITREREIRRRAEREGQRALAETGGTLRQAIRQLEVEAGLGGCTELAVVLADLPFATHRALAGVLNGPSSVAAVPAISDGGTNVLVRRPPTVIPARFGRSSFQKHRAEAYRRGVTYESIDSPALGFDLDRPADLGAVLEAENDSRTRAACLEMGLADRLRLHTPL